MLFAAVAKMGSGKAGDVSHNLNSKLTSVSFIFQKNSFEAASCVALIRLRLSAAARQAGNCMASRVNTNQDRSGGLPLSFLSSLTHGLYRRQSAPFPASVYVAASLPQHLAPPPFFLGGGGLIVLSLTSLLSPFFVEAVNSQSSSPPKR